MVANNPLLKKRNNEMDCESSSRNEEKNSGKLPQCYFLFVHAIGSFKSADPPGYSYFFSLHKFAFCTCTDHS